ncbi:MAG: RHS repeat-associated core domain-containing protein, partial [Opitutales bacterium]|nr:RHS repeat-associated core domain-containing protein [Opitutales bacterium]
RRTEYKSVTNGAQNTWLRFLYDGYLCVQVLYSNEPYNVFKEFVWDPTEPVATRPLVFRYAPNSLNLFYAFDGNKNVSDVFYRMNSNGIGAHYDYAPFGGTTRTRSDSSASFDIVVLNPFRFSSEYYDSELDLVYYNYRHYSPSLGRFLSRDPIEEQGGLNLYAFVGNNGVCYFDLLGNAAPAVLLPLGITISAAEAAAAVMGLSVAACLSDPTCRELALRYTQDGITEVLVKARQLACVAAYHEYHHLSCRKCSSRSPVMHSTLNCACWGHVVLWRSAYLSMKCDYFLEGSIKSPQGSIEKERGHQEQLENAIRAMKKCCENLCSDDDE